MNDREVPGLEIRIAGPDDAGILAQMVAELAEFERLGDVNNSTEETLRAELSAPDRVLEAVVATVDGAPVGMATVFHTYSTFAAKRGVYLEDLYVVHDWRHRGVGTAILRYVARRAIDQGFGRMEWTTLLWNTDAIEFYEALGATPNEAWTTYRLSGAGLARLADADRAAARGDTAS